MGLRGGGARGNRQFDGIEVHVLIPVTILLISKSLINGRLVQKKSINYHLTYFFNSVV